jgi:hypothetical protein
MILMLLLVLLEQVGYDVIRSVARPAGHGVPVPGLQARVPRRRPVMTSGEVIEHVYR